MRPLESRSFALGTPIPTRLARLLSSTGEGSVTTTEPGVLSGRHREYRLSLQDVRHGGHALVFRADSPEGPVAVKVAKDLRDNVWIERERKAHASLPANADWAIDLLDSGSTPDGCFFLVFPWVQDSLRSWVVTAQPSLVDRLTALRSACDALHQLHHSARLEGAHRLHRDIKPDNLLLVRRESPSLVLADLGGFKQATRDHTQAQTDLHTPVFAPLEQALALDGRIDPSVNVYALAATVYWTLVGDVPRTLLKRQSRLTDAGYRLCELAGQAGAELASLRALPLEQLIQLDDAPDLERADQGRLLAALEDRCRVDGLDEDLARSVCETLVPALEQSLTLDPRRRSQTVVALREACEAALLTLGQASAALPALAARRRPRRQPTRWFWAGGAVLAVAAAAGAMWRFQDPSEHTEELRLAPEGEDGNFGIVAIVGDVNGDGRDDMIVGAPRTSSADAFSGSARLYLGGPVGVIRQSERRLLPPDPRLGDHFGSSVSSAGDVNGDGFMDVLIASPGRDDPGSDAGVVYLFFGSESGLDETHPQVIRSSQPSSLAHFGARVSSAGDVNGDGFDDVIIAASYGGQQTERTEAPYVYLGSADGLKLDSETRLRVPGQDSTTLFGASIAAAGDLDGDGFDDVVVGASRDPKNGENSGAAYVFYGAEEGVGVRPPQRLEAPSGRKEARFGQSVAGVGDVDRDGYDDLVIGSPVDEEHGFQVGKADVFYGGPAGVGHRSTELISTDASRTWQFGLSVAGAGDVNGDGYADVLIGAVGADDERGYAYIFYGGCDGVRAFTEDKLVASDGAPERDFARWIAGGGDVDGDGRDDVLIGSHKAPTGDVITGAAYLFPGSGARPSTPPKHHCPTDP